MKKFFNTYGFLFLGLFVLILSLSFQLRYFFQSLFVKSFEPITSTDVDSKIIAEQLYVAMKGFGTDEEKIYSLLKGMSKKDYVSVYNSFGLRWYQPQLGVWTDMPFTNGQKLDLNTWLSEELTQSEFEKLRELSPAIFS